MDGLLGRIDRNFIATITGPATKQQTANIIAAAACLPPMMRQFSITTDLRIAHFFAQISHESDAFRTTAEYASGAEYEGRADLGNTKPGDGVRFKGHGLIQDTGRDNHEKFTLWMRSIDPSCPDFLSEPERLEEFPWAAWVAVWYWSTRSLNVLADRDDLIGITRKVNGGTNGLKQRGVFLARAKAAIAKLSASDISVTQNFFPVLHRGDTRTDMVECLQRLLTQAGYYHLTIDGDFGAGTDGAVRLLQAKIGLKVDGIAGEKTYNALLALLKLNSGGAPWTQA